MGFPTGLTAIAEQSGITLKLPGIRRCLTKAAE